LILASRSKISRATLSLIQAARLRRSGFFFIFLSRVGFLTIFFIFF